MVFYHFIFNFYLKWISYGRQVVGWCFLTHSLTISFHFFRSFRFNLIFYKVQYSALIGLFFLFVHSVLFLLWSYICGFFFDYMNFLGIIYLPIGIFIFIYTQRFTVSVALPSFSNFQVTLLYFSLYPKLYSLVFLLEQSQWKKIFLVFLHSGLH